MPKQLVASDGWNHLHLSSNGSLEVLPNLEEVPGNVEGI